MSDRLDITGRHPNANWAPIEDISQLQPGDIIMRDRLGHRYIIETQQDGVVTASSIPMRIRLTSLINYRVLVRDQKK